MLGRHSFKTWSASQEGFALSSAEAELYWIIEAVTRAKGLLSLASELEFDGLSNVVQFAIDSSAAKTFCLLSGIG